MRKSLKSLLFLLRVGRNSTQLSNSGSMFATNDTTCPFSPLQSGISWDENRWAPDSLS